MLKTRLIFIVSFVIAIASCDRNRTIDPFEDDIGSFSVYGAIELGKDNNSIRIRNVSIPFLADSTIGYEEIEVSLKEVDSGRSVDIEEKLVNQNGNYTVNYVILEDLEPRIDYEFSITDEFGNVVSSVFKMPGINTHRINQNRILDCYHPIKFYWDNVIAPEYILMEVGVDYQGQRYWGEVQRIDEPDHVPGANQMQMELTVRQLLVDVFPPPFGGEASTSLPLEKWPPTVECYELDNNIIHVRYIHFGQDWEQFEETSYYIFDYLDSGEITNGIGFLGGIRRDRFSFTVEEMN